MILLKIEEKENNYSTTQPNGQPYPRIHGLLQDRISSSNVITKKALKVSDSTKNNDSAIFDRKLIACKAFAKTRECKYGENCRYSHAIGEPSNKTATSSEPTGDALCQFVVKYGNCKQGEKCFKASKHYESLLKHHKDKVIGKPRTLG